jgi:hypothetical protein
MYSDNYVFMSFVYKLVLGYCLHMQNVVCYLISQTVLEVHTALVEHVPVSVFQCYHCVTFCIGKVHFLLLCIPTSLTTIHSFLTQSNIAKLIAIITVA